MQAFKLKENIEDKKDLIDNIEKLKAKGIKQKDVAKKLCKSLRTIKNYWSVSN